jgi:outer membrane lipoprotein-sorting protein
MRPNLLMPLPSAIRILALAALVSPTLAASQSAALPTPTRAQIIQGIDAAVQKRLEAIPRYTVQEQYNIYRNGSKTPSAQETIQTTYIRNTGKDYKPIAQSGSSFMRSAIIDKVLASEKEINLPANREAALLTSHNYDFIPEPGSVEQYGKTCIVVDLHPRRKSQHLFTGKMWIDAADYSIVHIEGAPSESVSFFAGQTTVSRDYAKVSGYSMATHAEARSHSFLLGDTLLTIDYTNYHVDLDQLSATSQPQH